MSQQKVSVKRKIAIVFLIILAVGTMKYVGYNIINMVYTPVNGATSQVGEYRIRTGESISVSMGGVYARSCIYGGMVNYNGEFEGKLWFTAYSGYVWYLDVEVGTTFVVGDLEYRVAAMSDDAIRFVEVIQ